MDTITIAVEEYHFLKKCRDIVKVVETAIHSGDDFKDLTTLSESVAKELWENKYDLVWDKI